MNYYVIFDMLTFTKCMQYCKQKQNECNQIFLGRVAWQVTLQTEGEKERKVYFLLYINWIFDMPSVICVTLNQHELDSRSEYERKQAVTVRQIFIANIRFITTNEMTSNFVVSSMYLHSWFIKKVWL